MLPEDPKDFWKEIEKIDKSYITKKAIFYLLYRLDNNQLAEISEILREISKKRGRYKTKVIEKMAGNIIF